MMGFFTHDRFNSQCYYGIFHNDWLKVTLVMWSLPGRCVRAQGGLDVLDNYGNGH